MTTEEKEIFKAKLKSAILDSPTDFLRMKKKLGQKIVTQIDGKIVTRSPDYFFEKIEKISQINPPRGFSKFLYLNSVLLKFPSHF